MKITAIHCSRHRIQLAPAFVAAWDPIPRSSFETTIVRVDTDVGLSGIGGGGSMAGFDPFADLFIGQSALELERHFQILSNLQFHFGRYWALDIALWDLYGKSLNLPVYQLLGGQSGRLPVYASLGTVHDSGAMAAQILALKDAGFRAAKIRFHNTNWRKDVDIVAAVRDAVGGDMVLMVDCNQGWRMPSDTRVPWHYDIAIAVAEALQDFDIHWLEEPLHRGDYEGMSRLRRNTAIPIAGGEMTREMHELHSLVDRNCIDILQADAALTQGISGLSNLMPKLRRAEVAFSPHTWGDGIGLLANAQLAAGVGAPAFLEFPFDPPTWTLERRDFMLQTPISIDAEGCMNLPLGPGLGVELDEARLRHTQVD